MWGRPTFSYLYIIADERARFPFHLAFSLSAFFVMKIKEFYGSPQWKQCRETYKKSVGGLCEECLKKGLISPAEEVHHIIKLTNENCNDPSVSLNPKNLMALCKACHDEKHRRVPRRVHIDECGRVTPI